MRFSQFILVTLAVLNCADVANAQLFGPRNVGRNSRQRPPSLLRAMSTGAEGGLPDVRERPAGDFVGSDRRDATFVGSAQATTDGSVTLSVEGLREQIPPGINRPRVRRSSGIYPERLSVAFTYPAEGFGTISRDADGNVPDHLGRLAERRGFEVERRPHDRSTVVTGTVPTEHDRQIAALLASFEPGVESVTNEIQVEQSNPGRVERRDSQGPPRLRPLAPR